MPDKDGSEDKKSTKSVVNKKQKQFMNQEEQLDLSSVAESFGGQIVGEPVELDEDGGVISIPTAAVLAKYGIPLAITAIGAYGTDRAMRGKPITIPNLGIKDKAKNVYGKIKNVFATANTQQQRNKYKKKTVVRNQPFSWGTFKKSDNKNQNNKGRNLAIAGASGMGLQKAISTLTKTKDKGKGFRMGGLPGTAHNVGRRSNPQ